MCENSTGKSRVSRSDGFDTGEKGALAYGGFSKKTAIHAARAPIAGQMDARDAAREISDE
jgi:hypothetical protein